VLLSWASAAGQAGMGCACSVSSLGARRARPQASQAWLKHPVFQAQARGEGREGKGKEEKGREGRGGEGKGGRDRVAHCVCVFLCAHVGGPHNVPLVCLTRGGSQGSSPLGASPQLGGRGGQAFPSHLCGQSLPACAGSLEEEPLSSAGGSPAASPTARHMTSEGGGGRRAGSPSARPARGYPGAHAL
jgi:hypothetical protein